MSYEWPATLPTLQGPRLDLRWLTAADATALFEIFGDREVMQFWSSPPLEHLAAASQLVEEIHQYFDRRELFQWGIHLRETGEIVGTVTLHHVDMSHGRAEVGFALGRRWWGRKLAMEALDVLFRFAFETLQLHRLEADADPDNLRSIRTLERQGFTREGYLRERWLHLGERRDTVMFGLLGREWPRRNAT